MIYGKMIKLNNNGGSGAKIIMLLMDMRLFILKALMYINLYK